ncbi:hypothetical protein ACWD0A_34240 [Streptomyces sp. NPDC002867]
MGEKQAQPVSLNDVSDLVELLKRGGLKELLQSGDAIQPRDCDCHSGMACKGRAGVEELRPPSLEEMMSYKKERIAELRRQIEEAEQLIAEAESDSTAG